MLLDFFQAFDTINISLLLSKLVYYGFDKLAVKWFDSYLCNRYQCVKISRSNGSVSSSYLAQVSSGVLQGSILGHLLFIILTSLSLLH